MKRVVLTAILLFAVFSGLYVWFEDSGWLTASTVRAWITGLQASPWAVPAVAAAVFGLLLVDIVLPVPSSVVMTLAGMVLGVWGGALASFLGAMGAALTAYWACRLGGAAAFERMSGSQETRKVEAWFERYGVFAIILSRPVPMLTEVLSCLAGLSGMRHRVFVLAATLGTLPVCLVYSIAGHYGGLANPWPAVVVALGIPAAGWAALRIANRHARAAVAQEDARASQESDPRARTRHPRVRLRAPRFQVSVFRQFPETRTLNTETSEVAQERPGGRLHAWGELMRLPNLFTVPGDVLAGFLLAAAATAPLTRWLQADLAVMVAAVLAVYIGGLILNDVFDVETDRAQRPHRPLPSGRIALRTAASAGAVLLGGAVLLVYASVGAAPAALLAAVACCAVSYDALKERLRSGGVVLMALCRAGALLCGAAAMSLQALERAPVWVAAGSVLVYTMVVTALARGETTRRRLGTPALLPTVVLLGTALLAGGMLAAAHARLWPAALFVLAAAESAWGAQRVLLGRTPVPPFIGQLIRIMVVSQCAWCAVAYALHRAGGQGLAASTLAGVLVLFAILRAGAEFAGARFHGS